MRNLLRLIDLYVKSKPVAEELGHCGGGGGVYVCVCMWGGGGGGGFAPLPGMQGICCSWIWNWALCSSILLKGLESCGGCPLYWGGPAGGLYFLKSLKSLHSLINCIKELAISCPYTPAPHLTSTRTVLMEHRLRDLLSFIS